jgi:hypothetical protein
MSFTSQSTIYLIKINFWRQLIPENIKKPIAQFLAWVCGRRNATQGGDLALVGAFTKCIMGLRVGGFEIYL